ncbi:MAG: metallophosphoesterase [bacterium]
MEALRSFRRVGLCVLALAVVPVANGQQPSSHQAPAVIQFVLTSDVHFGITRHAFRGDTGVRSAFVNTAMIAQMNRLPEMMLPADSGAGAGRRVGAIDFVAITGDIANRAELGVQSARTSWTEFTASYGHLLHLRDASGQPSQLYLVAGNHDISNAIGYTRPLSPVRDASSAAGIYNLMLHPATPLTAETYEYARHRAHYGITVRGVHLAFLNLWPDSVERAWLADDLSQVSSSTPVLLFAHDPPASDAKHFINPNGTHDLNASDRFENLMSDTYADGNALPPAGTPKDAESVTAQRRFTPFLKAHANIKAYFHGHSNYNEFYDWRGIDDDVRLPTFRVDSPMKGAISAIDETQLSFQLVTIDMATDRMTVRECFWNATPGNPATGLRFGASRTIALR